MIVGSAGTALASWASGASRDIESRANIVESCDGSRQRTMADKSSTGEGACQLKYQQMSKNPHRSYGEAPPDLVPEIYTTSLTRTGNWVTVFA